MTVNQAVLNIMVQIQQAVSRSLISSQRPKVVKTIHVVGKSVLGSNIHDIEV